MIKIIAAIGKNRELGKNNDLIWHLPGDLKFFKEQTLGSVVAMGKNTFNSLPKKLPDRKHIVLADDDIFNKDVEDVIVMHDKLEFIKLCNLEAEKADIFIIGGASIYNMFIGLADELYLTEIEAEAPADVYFPEFDKNNWKKEVLSSHEYDGIKYSHVKYYDRTDYGSYFDLG
ncbi:MAG: dihydrofolate reductase [Clostridia bacterium]|nr:dihydrofolate reductase [Clostridia bacterium]